MGMETIRTLVDVGPAVELELDLESAVAAMYVAFLRSAPKPAPVPSF